MGWDGASVPAVSPLPSHCPTAPSRQECVTGCWFPVPALTWVGFSHSCAAYQGKTSVSTVGTSTSAYRLSLATMSRSNTGTGTVWEQDSEPSQQASQDTLSRTDEEDEESTWLLIWAKLPTLTVFSGCPRGQIGRGRQLSLSQCEQKAHGGTRLWIWCWCYTVHGLKAWVIPYLLIPSWSLGGEKEGPEQTSSVWDPGWHVVPTVLARH